MATEITHRLASNVMVLPLMQVTKASTLSIENNNDNDEKENKNIQISEVILLYLLTLNEKHK